MKCTRQRCQVALSTLLTAALIPSWASEMTSLTPRSRGGQACSGTRSRRKPPWSVTTSPSCYTLKATTPGRARDRFEFMSLAAIGANVVDCRIGPRASTGIITIRLRHQNFKQTESQLADDHE